MALTEVDKEAARTTQSGGMTNLMPNQNSGTFPGSLGSNEIQTAGMFKEGLGLFRSIWRALEPIADPNKNVNPLMKPDPSTKGVGPRVPERLVEGVQREGFSYTKTQDAIAREKLSPEGYKRWVEQGRKAAKVPTDEEVILEEALKAQRADTGVGTTTGVDERVADEILSSRDKAIASIKAGSDGGMDFNFANLETGDDVKALIDEVARTYSDATLAAKRGVKTNIQTQEEASALLADDLNLTKRLLKKRPGGMLNAEEMTAVRSLMVRSAEKLDLLSKAVATGNAPAETMLAFRRQLAIHAGIQMQAKAAQTEIARALQAFRIPVGMDLGPTNTAIKEMLDATGGTKEAQKLAMSYRTALKNGGQKSANELAMKGWAAKGQGIWEEIYVNGLLSWTSTQLKNVFGTPVWMTYQLGQEIGAGVFGTVRRAITGQDEGVYLSEPFMRIKGYSQSFKDSWIVASKVARTEMPADAVSKIEGLQYKNIDAENLNIDPAKHHIWAMGTNALGRVIRAPGTALEFADTFWKVMSQRAELYARAAHEAAVVRRQGGSETEAVDAAIMRWMDPRGVGEDLDLAARVSTLTQDAGWLGDFAKNFQRAPVFGRILMPFARIPTNTVRLTADNSVLQAVNRKAYKDLMGFNGEKAFDRRMGNVSLAAGTGYMIAEMAMSGRITGGMPRSQKQRNMLPPGWQPYSLVFKGENWPKDANGEDLPLFDKKTGLYNGPVTYLRYSGLEPVGAFFGLIAQAVEYSRRNDDPTKVGDYVSSALWASLEYFLSLPFLDGMASVIHGMERNDISIIADGPLGSMVGPLPLPYSSAIRNIGRAGQRPVTKLSTSRELYTVDDVEKMTLEANKNRAPSERLDPDYRLVGLPKDEIKSQFLNFLDNTAAMQKRGGIIKDDPESEAIQYDVLGNPKVRGYRFDMNPVLATYNMVSPWSLQPGKKPSELLKEVVRVGMPLTNNRRKLKGVRLTEKQQSDWVNIAKNQIEINIKGLGRGLSFREALERRIDSRLYNHRRSTKEDQFKMLNKIEDQFFEAAIEYLIEQKGNENLAEAYLGKLELKE